MKKLIALLLLLPTLAFASISTPAPNNVNGGGVSSGGIPNVSNATGTLPIAHGGTGSNSGVANASVTPPSNPTTGTLWNCSSLACLHASAAPLEHYPVYNAGTGQEQTVFITNGNYVNVFSGPSGGIWQMTCPTTADITASATFYGSVSGSTLTVSEPGLGTTPSPDLNGPILPGMIIKAASGLTGTAVVQAYGTSGTTGTGRLGTYALSISPGNITNQTVFANFWTVPVLVLGNGTGGIAGQVAHGGVYIEGATAYDFFTELTGVATTVSTTNTSTTLTVNSVTSAGELITPGMTVSALNDAAGTISGVANGTTIVSQLTGTTGGAGTYQMSAAATANNSTVTASLGAQNVRMASASLPSLSSWAASTSNVIVPSNVGGCRNNMGNSWVAKQAGTYYLFQECAFNVTLPVEGATTPFEVIEASSSTVGGSYTATITPLTSIFVTPNAGMSHVRPYYEASTNQWVAYMHGADWGRFSLPTSLYRATNTDISKDSWVVTDNKAPLMSWRHPIEVDQVCDPDAVVNGNVAYLFFTAADNATSNNVFRPMVTPLLPTLYQYDGAAWRLAESGYDTFDAFYSPKVWYAENINPVIIPPSNYNNGPTGTWANSSDLTNGGPALVSDGVQNDKAGWWLTPMAPGTYKVTFTYDTCAACGIITPTLNVGTFGQVAPQNGATTIDTYSASTVYGVQSSVTFSVLGTSTFRKQLQLLMATKNASSSGYVLMLKGIAVQRTSF